MVALQVAIASSAAVPRKNEAYVTTTMPTPQGAACVAGVNLLQVPETTMMFQRAGMITPDGRCKTLDASADGYTRGEACASVVLVDPRIAAKFGASPVTMMPVDILGAFVNQDGRSSTLTAPNGPAQQTAIRGAIAVAGGGGIGDVGTVQMHGTGTPLGDPIEVGALAAVFNHSESGAGGGFGALTLAAPKAAIGHGEAGIKNEGT